MYPTDPIYTANMNGQQRAWFYAEYERARKDEMVGFLLALFLGCFGAHHFYLRRNTAGVIYLLFFWTGITAILGLIECFFMPSRVRQYNAAQAMYIASQILANASSTTASHSATVSCPACSHVNELGAIFCRHCGSAIGGNNHLATQPVV
jgi:TM2 domain-containing membrane protein YozV